MAVSKTESATDFPKPTAREAATLLVFFSFAIVQLLHLEVPPYAIIDAIERNLTNAGTVLAHGHPQDVVDIPRAVLVKVYVVRAFRRRGHVY